jgi:hypothetical protein
MPPRGNAAERGKAEAGFNPIIRFRDMEPDPK